MKGPLLPLAGIALGGILGWGITRVPWVIGGDPWKTAVMGAVSGAITGAFLGYWEWIPRRKRWDLAGLLPPPLRGLYAGLWGGPASVAVLILTRVEARRIEADYVLASLTFLNLCLNHWLISLPVGLLLGVALLWARRRRPGSPVGE